MSDKIEWFQEVLSLEPGSRVFFPLARLYVGIGEMGNAATTLKMGLDRHPEHLEARMLYIQVLSELGRTDEALEEVKRVVEPLRQYPAFWRLWAQGQPDENRDFAVFLMLVAAGMQGETIHWTDIMLEGVNTLSERLVGPLPESAPKPVPAPKAAPGDAPRSVADDDDEGLVLVATCGCDDEEGTLAVPTDGPSPLRTKTMASVLAAQGDYAGALDIYRELWSRSGGDEKQELQGRIEKIEADMGEPEPKGDDRDEDVFSHHAKNRLLSTLETLAARFEARVRS